MESVMTNMAPAYYFYTAGQSPEDHHGNFVSQQMHMQQQHLQHQQLQLQLQQQQQHHQQNGYYYALPPTPTYSRPSSSSSQQHMQPQPVLMSQPQPLKSFSGAVQGYAMIPSSVTQQTVGSNVPRSVKPTIMLETDFVNVDGLPRMPSTPALSSTASSTTGSPSACDMLATPLNPMFSGLDSFGSTKEVNVAEIATEQFNAAGWSNCASPPFTPVFIQGQNQSAKALAPNQEHCTPTALSSDLLSVSACPSLSPSPSPYARSVASEQDNDFCDPRNLTVSCSEGSVSPAFSAIQAASLSPAADAEEDVVPHTESAVPAVEVAETPAAATPASIVSPVADFVPHSLAVLEEFPELESDEDFVNNLVNLGGDYSSVSSISTPELSIRSRASSAATAHSELEFFDSWETSYESADSQHVSKRQRTTSGSFPIMSASGSSDAGDASTSGSPEQASEAHNENNEHHDHGEHGDSCNDSGDMASGTSSPEADNGNGTSTPMPTNRRGRKQSLTEDPSKIFACDLCNRRFRRQEHLKRHYRSLHTHDKPFNCHECGKKFSRSDNLAQHARTHGAGALVMNVFDDPELVAAAGGSYMPHLMYPGQGVPMGDDYSEMGHVLFQVASEVPGSASEHSEDGADSQGKKKRKRMD